MAEMLDFLFKINAIYSGSEQVQKASAAMSQLQQKTQELQKVSSKISGFQKQAQKLTELRSKLDAARAKVKDMQTTMRGGEKVDAKAFTKANEEAAKLQRQVMENTKKLGEFRAELRGAGIDTSDLAGAQARLKEQTDKMTQAQERLNKAQAKMSGIKSTLSWDNVKKEVVQPLLPVIGAVKSTVKLAADFESAMARVKSVAFSDPDADLTQFNILREQALHLGAVTKFTSIQAAAAQENLLRANMSPQDVLDALPAVLNMASAEGMDIDQAAGIVAKGLGGMGLEAKLAPRLADILAYTSAKSNTNIAEIGEAFKIAAPVLSAQGATMEQIAAYIGGMASKGYTGSDAGNALAASVMRLAKLPAEGKAMLKELGVGYITREGKMATLPAIAADMYEAMKKRGYGEARQLEVIEAVFGKGYGKAMQGFVSASAAGDVQRLQTGEYTESFGRAKVMADINLDTLNGQLDILSSSWDGLRTTIGEIYSPVVREGVEMLSNALANLNAVMKESPILAKSITWAVTGIASFKAVKGIWNIGSALLSLPGAWLEFMRAGSAAGEVIAGGGGVLAKISAAFGALKVLILAHPLLALGALAAGVVTLVIMNWDKVKAWWNNWFLPNIWEPVKNTCAVVSDYVSKQWKRFDDWWNSWTLADIWQSAMNRLDEVIAQIKAKWQELMDWLGQFNPLNWEMPSWLGGGKGGDNQVKNAETALNSWGIPDITRHAEGGILTRPHFGLVAEAGPEAVIPLRDKPRGISLLMKAAEILGVQNFAGSQNFSDSQNFTRTLIGGVSSSSSTSSTSSIKELADNVAGVRELSEGNVYHSDNHAVTQWPQVNLTVNIQGEAGTDAEGLAGKIADKVREVLSEIVSLEERVSYA